MKQISCFAQWLLIGSFISLNAHASNVQFESAEHIFMGDQVVLTGLHQQTTDQPIKLPLHNGLQLTYGEVLAMPDYYGDLHHQISSEKSIDNQKARFSQIFHDFSHSDVAYFHAFWPVIQNERDAVSKAIKAGEDVTAVYKKIDAQEEITLAAVTQLRYLNLALTGFDHFNQDAITAYVAGHAVAIETALAGYRIKSGENEKINQLCASQADYASCIAAHAKQKLIKAYEENAFASHFLSDRFAAGHMRTPYRMLYETRPIAVLGGLSGNLMHGEDNRLGVIVTNDSGNDWIAYGDQYYFSAQNKINREILKNTLQLSVDEITSAYQTGIDEDPSSAKLIGFIPRPISAGTVVTLPDVGAVQQTAPLYQIILGGVWQRIDVNNPDDDQWTPIWSTLLTLFTYHSPNQCNVPMKWQLILKAYHLNDRVGIE